MNDDTQGGLGVNPQQNISSQDTPAGDEGIFGAPFNLATNPQSEAASETPRDSQQKPEDLFGAGEMSAKQENIQKSSVVSQAENIETPKDNGSIEKTPEKDVVSGGVTFMDSLPKEEDIFSTVVPEKKIQSSEDSSKESPQIFQAPLAKNIESVSVKTEDLEDDFSQTFNSPLDAISPNQNNPIAEEEEKLKRIHKELKNKAASKKIIVKERLEKLKLEKESLGKELGDIKELEAIAAKIEEKLKSLEIIDTEIDTLEKQALEELQ